MTTKIPTSWLPQPLGYGSVTPITQGDITTNTLVNITDNHGSPLLTGTISVSGKTPTKWGATGN